MNKENIFSLRTGTWKFDYANIDNDIIDLKLLENNELGSSFIDTLSKDLKMDILPNFTNQQNKTMTHSDRSSSFSLVL